MENQVETLNNRTFRHSLSSSLQNANFIRHYHETQPYWFTLAQIASNRVIRINLIQRSVSLGGPIFDSLTPRLLRFVNLQIFKRNLGLEF